MKIFKIIKEFFCPKMYSGIEIAEMGKNVKFDYYLRSCRFDLQFKQAHGF